MPKIEIPIVEEENEIINYYCSPVKRYPTPEIRYEQIYEPICEEKVELKEEEKQIEDVKQIEEEIKPLKKENSLRLLVERIMIKNKIEKNGWKF